jgi:hypothetical protein
MEEASAGGFAPCHPKTGEGDDDDEDEDDWGMTLGDGN